MEDKGKNYVMKVETGRILLTPYMLANISEDLHKCSDACRPAKHFPLVNYYLYMSAIEKGLKAAILSKDIKGKRKRYLRSKEVGHDLVKVYEEFKCLFDSELLTPKEKEVLVSINNRYIKKGFEYFDDDMILQTLTGFKDIPKLEDIQKISEKINKFIADNKYFS